MPYVDLYSKDDYASIFYTTSSVCNNVGGFDPNKPTIIILHPMFLDSTWLEGQLGDPRLYKHYNLIAFDMRTAGRSTCQPSGKHDSWVDAADLAFCHQKLHLPPCHVFALEAMAVNCAVRFALLFPEMCLSLALCNVPAPMEERWNYNAFEELIHSWCFSEDLEGLEHAASELLSFLIGPNSDSDLQDQLVAYWEKTIPPRNRPWVIESLSVLINRTPLDPEIYAQITQPVLILHGDRNELCPRQHSETLAAQLANAQNGAVIYTVKGASTLLSIFPGSASIVNQTLAKFLSRTPAARSDVVPPEVSISDRMRTALERQAGLVKGKNIKTLDPLSPLSFSCLTEQVVKIQTDLLSQYSKDRLSAFHPLNSEGRPFRKLSEGKFQDWFQSGAGGISVAGERVKQDQDRPTRKDRENQIVKPALNSTNVGEYVMKGPIAGVVRETPAAPLARILMQYGV